MYHALLDRFRPTCAKSPLRSCASQQGQLDDFILKSMAPPSHHVRPVASVPSLRAAAVAILRLDGGAGGHQHLDHLQVAVGSRKVQRPLASVRRAPLEMATGRAKSHGLLRRISEDFGSEKLGVWSCLVHHF